MAETNGKQYVYYLEEHVKDCEDVHHLVSSKRKAVEWFQRHIAQGFQVSEYSDQSAYKEYDDVDDGEVVSVHWYKERVW